MNNKSSEFYPHINEIRKYNYDNFDDNDYCNVVDDDADSDSDDGSDDDLLVYHIFCR